MGGGVCQLSSTIFQTVLKGNFSIVERHNHSLKVSYVPVGGDATVQWTSLDFQFRNNYDCDVRLEFSVKDGKLTCSIYAKEEVDVPKVEVKVKNNGKNSYTLTRYADGKKNYTTKSKYK